MQKRYVSLDILRGLTIACMVMVNNPGSAAHRYDLLRHSPWSGCTVCDLVFPFFLFCAGVAMAFSLSGYTRLPSLGAKKVLRRGVLIFLVGLAMNMFPFVPVVPHDAQASFGENWLWWLQHVRIFGVLQRIGMCYIIGGLMVLFLKSPGKVAYGIAALLFVHWFILRHFGDGSAWATLDGNISGSIDIALVGENHVYHGYGIPFDPEGVLGALSGTGTLLIGYLAGNTIRSAKNAAETSATIFAASALCLALGCIWSIWLPINKPMWTGSYVLYSGGWALFVLALLIYCVDLRGFGRIFTPFRIMGTNPLAIYVIAGIFVRIFRSIVSWKNSDGVSVTPLNWYYDNCCAALFGDGRFASLVYALTLVGLMFLVGLFLYRRKIIIRL